MWSAVQRFRRTVTTLRWFFGRGDLPLTTWPTASCHDLPRILAWYRRRPEKRFARRTLDARVDQVVRGYVNAALAERFRYRELFAQALDDPADACLPFALHLAARLAVPEAREKLLALTTKMLGCEPDAPNRASDPAANLRPVLVRALGRLRDASLLPLFEKLLERTAEPSVAYQAAWAIALLTPFSSRTGHLIGGRAEDPVFLADLLEADLPDVREATLAFLKRRPAACRNTLAAALPLRPDERTWLTAD